VNNLKKLDNLLSDPKAREEINELKNTFTECEVVYKVILSEYLSHKKKTVNQKQLKINMTQVKPALKFAGYNFDDLLLQKIFGSEEKVGNRSVKKLRDALTHKPNQSCLNELKKRKTELYGCMNKFLQEIRSYK